MKRKLIVTLLFSLLASVSVLAQKHLEYPEIKKGEIIIYHTGHTLSYNPGLMLPNWVAYELHATDLIGEAERLRSFSPDPDPKLREYELAQHWHYTNSGWVRGHMVPAGDLKYDQNAMRDSFYTTNICPMNMKFNNSIWKRLEEKVRLWAEEYGHVYIVCGPLIGDNRNGKVGNSNITVPDAFFKAVLVPYDNSYLSIGFIMANTEETKGKLRDYACTVREVETISGLNLFSGLPKSVANKIEGQLPLKELGLY